MKVTPIEEPRPIVRCEMTQDEVNVLVAIADHVRGNHGAGYPRFILQNICDALRSEATPDNIIVAGVLSLERRTP